MSKLLATCSTNSLRDIRDRAILMVAFASSGGRRNEFTALHFDQLTIEPPMALPSMAIYLRQTKIANGDDYDVVYGVSLQSRNATGVEILKFWGEASTFELIGSMQALDMP